MIRFLRIKYFFLLVLSASLTTAIIHRSDGPYPSQGPAGTHQAQKYYWYNRCFCATASPIQSTMFSFLFYMNMSDTAYSGATFEHVCESQKFGFCGRPWFNCTEQPCTKSSDECVQDCRPSYLSNDLDPSCGEPRQKTTPTLDRWPNSCNPVRAAGLPKAMDGQSAFFCESCPSTWLEYERNPALYPNCLCYDFIRCPADGKRAEYTTVQVLPTLEDRPDSGEDWECTQVCSPNEFGYAYGQDWAYKRCKVTQMKLPPDHEYCQVTALKGFPERCQTEEYWACGFKNAQCLQYFSGSSDDQCQYRESWKDETPVITINYPGSQDGYQAWRNFQNCDYNKTHPSNTPCCESNCSLSSNTTTCVPDEPGDCWADTVYCSSLVNLDSKEAEDYLVLQYCGLEGPNSLRFKNSSFLCNESSSVCEEDSFCPGNHHKCPAKVPRTVGTFCADPVFECEEVRLCDGVSRECPEAVVKPLGAPCNKIDNTNNCTFEFCDGSSRDCNFGMVSDGVTCFTDSMEEGVCDSGDCVACECDRSDPCCNDICMWKEDGDLCQEEERINECLLHQYFCFNKGECRRSFVITEEGVPCSETAGHCYYGECRVGEQRCDNADEEIFASNNDDVNSGEVINCIQCTPSRENNYCRDIALDDICPDRRFYSSCQTTGFCYGISLDYQRVVSTIDNEHLDANLSIHRYGCYQPMETNAPSSARRQKRSIQDVNILTWGCVPGKEYLHELVEFSISHEFESEKEIILAAANGNVRDSLICLCRKTDDPDYQDYRCAVKLLEPCIPESLKLSSPSGQDYFAPEDPFRNAHLTIEGFQYNLTADEMVEKDRSRSKRQASTSLDTPIVNKYLRCSRRNWPDANTWAIDFIPKIAQTNGTGYVASGISTIIIAKCFCAVQFFIFLVIFLKGFLEKLDLAEHGLI